MQSAVVVLAIGLSAVGLASCDFAAPAIDEPSPTPSAVTPAPKFPTPSPIRPPQSPPIGHPAPD